jgi:16S rRNA (guanine527-N7)-methyltransferase
MHRLADAGERLRAGVAELGLDARERQIEALLEYLALLLRWNSSYNLTAVREPGQMVVRHLLDSLAVLPHLTSSPLRVIDVGSGGGLPGVPLAIMCPQHEFDLLDSNGKKARFLFQVKTALGLDNMAVRHARVEAWSPDHVYDAILSRAFASLADMVSCCSHLCDEGTRLLAMKGQVPDEEIAALGQDVRVAGIHRLLVPGLEEERHLVELRLLGSFREKDATGKSFG